MPRSPQFTLEFAPETIDHLNAIESKFHSLIAKTVDEQLRFAPEQETRNRKPLEGPNTFGTIWELRFGPSNRFRVFYEVDRVGPNVEVLAIGVKEGNRLFIGSRGVQI